LGANRQPGRHATLSHIAISPRGDPSRARRVVSTVFVLLDERTSQQGRSLESHRDPNHTANCHVLVNVDTTLSWVEQAADRFLP
jgi:hypothetical protein